MRTGTYFKHKGTILFLLGMLIIIVFCIFGTMTVNAVRHQKMTDEAYTEFEKTYRDRVRAYMDDLGYKNAGIMLTKVVDCDGKRTYTLEIHHRRFSLLSDEEKSKVITDLQGLAGIDTNNDTDVTEQKGEILQCKLPLKEEI